MSRGEAKERRERGRGRERPGAQKEVKGRTEKEASKARQAPSLLCAVYFPECESNTKSHECRVHTPILRQQMRSRPPALW